MTAILIARCPRCWVALGPPTTVPGDDFTVLIESPFGPCIDSDDGSALAEHPTFVLEAKTGWSPVAGMTFRMESRPA